MSEGTISTLASAMQIKTKAMISRQLTGSPNINALEYTPTTGTANVPMEATLASNMVTTLKNAHWQKIIGSAKT